MLIRGLPFPDELWYLVEHQVWARVDDGGAHASVGITSLGIRLAGEIYMCRPKLAGAAVEQGRSIAVVELAKAIVSVKSPVSGTVVETNPRLAAEPELVHRAPYAEGWIARIALQRFEADRAALLRGPEAAEALQRHAWLHQVE